MNLQVFNIYCITVRRDLYKFRLQINSNNTMRKYTLNPDASRSLLCIRNFLSLGFLVLSRDVPMKLLTKLKKKSSHSLQVSRMHWCALACAHPCTMHWVTCVCVHTYSMSYVYVLSFQSVTATL